MPKVKNAEGKDHIIKVCNNLNFPPPMIHKSLDSTSTRLRLLADEGAPHGTLVIAESQSDGRGRTGKRFLSPEGGLYMSILLKCDLPSESVSIITPTAAVATAMAIKKALDIDVSVKWVNDLFFEGKKVCGILTEAVRDASSGLIKYVILGIGVNVFEPREGFEEFSDVAGSLVKSSNDVSVKYLLAALITEYFFRLWDVGNSELIYTEYKTRMFILNSDIYVLRGNKKLRAKVVGLEKDFSLTAEFTDGRREKLTSGEISIIPDINS